MGGAGSGRSVAKTPTAKKSTSSRKFASNLTSLGFINGAKSSSSTNTTTTNGLTSGNNDNETSAVATPSKETTNSTDGASPTNVILI